MGPVVRSSRWLWRLTVDVVREYSRDGVGDLAAAITFWTLLSIPAAVLALVSTLSSLERVVGADLAERLEQEVVDFVHRTFADSETLTNTVRELFETPSAGVATFATLVALFSLSRAFAGLIRALDLAYEVPEGRPFWYLRIVAIGLGVGTIAVVAAGATLLAFLPRLGPISWAVGPAVVVVLVLWATTVFHIGPNHQTPWRFDLPGAVATAIGWIVATQGFALYVRLTAGANDVKSTVGAVLLAVTLMYVLSVVLILGAELNDVLARRAGVVDYTPPITDRARNLRERLRSRH